MPIQFGTSAVVHSNLGEAVMSALMGEDQFIWHKVAPIKGVTEPNGAVTLITRESILQVPGGGSPRDSGSSFMRTNLGASQVTYKCKDYGVEHPLDDQDRSTFATEFDAAAYSALIAGRQVWGMIEKVVGAALFNTTTFTGAIYTDNSATPWSVPTTDILGQIHSAMDAMRQRGCEPNTLVVPFPRWLDMLKNDALVGRVVPTARGSMAIMQQALGELLGLKNVLVGRDVYNTNGSATFSATSSWNASYASVCCVGEQDSAPSVMRTFYDTSRDGASAANPVIMMSYRDEPSVSDVFRANAPCDPKIIDSNFAQLLKVA